MQDVKPPLTKNISEIKIQLSTTPSVASQYTSSNVVVTNKQDSTEAVTYNPYLPKTNQNRVTYNPYLPLQTNASPSEPAYHLNENPATQPFVYSNKDSQTITYNHLSTEANSHLLLTTAAPPGIF